MEQILLAEHGVLEALAFVAMVCTTLYAGAALHLAVVEYPAWSRVGAEAALVQSVNSFQRAPLLQMPVAAAGCVAGIAVSLAGGGAMWTVAAVLIGFVVPFSLVIMPVNRSLFAPGREPDSAETRRLLNEWGAKHKVRTALSVIAAAAMILQFIDMTA